MKNKLKRFLLSVMAGVMVINAPLSVLAETTDVSTQGTDSVVVNNSDKSDVITDSSEENLTSKYTFKDVLNNDSTYDFLSNLNSSDRFLFLNGLNQKEYYQLISLLKYDYANSFSKKKKFDLYREVVKYYYSTFMNQIDEISNETLKEQYIEWDNELIQQINSECADVAKYEDSLVGSKDFDVKSLIDLFNEYFENFPSVMKQELTNEDKEKKLSEYVDKYFELQIETFGSKEDITYTFTENIYQMDVKGNEYELIDTQNKEITCKLLKDTDIINDYEGFTFAYYTINDNGDQITEFDSDNIQSGETLNIYYNRNQYAVIANKDDGIKEITSNVDIDSALYYGTEVELTAEVEDGYTWKEWTDETGESISDGDESVYKFTVPVGGISLTATAQKQVTSQKRAKARAAATYTVAYNSNGGTGSMPTDTVQYFQDYTTKGNFFLKDGYVFTGWNESPDGRGVNWTPYIGKSWKYQYNKSITLYAQWTKRTTPSVSEISNIDSSYYNSGLFFTSNSKIIKENDCSPNVKMTTINNNTVYFDSYKDYNYGAFKITNCAYDNDGNLCDVRFWTSNYENLSPTYDMPSDVKRYHIEIFAGSFSSNSGYPTIYFELDGQESMMRVNMQYYLAGTSTPANVNKQFGKVMDIDRAQNDSTMTSTMWKGNEGFRVPKSSDSSIYLYDKTAIAEWNSSTETGAYLMSGESNESNSEKNIAYFKNSFTNGRTYIEYECGNSAGIYYAFTPPNIDFNYTVKYDANGGSVEKTKEVCQYNKDYTVPTPTRKGYRFDYWESPNSNGYDILRTVIDGEYTINSWGNFYLSNDSEQPYIDNTISSNAYKAKWNVKYYKDGFYKISNPDGKEIAVKNYSEITPIGQNVILESPSNDKRHLWKILTNETWNGQNTYTIVSAVDGISSEFAMGCGGNDEKSRAHVVNLEKSKAKFLALGNLSTSWYLKINGSSDVNYKHNNKSTQLKANDKFYNLAEKNGEVTLKAHWTPNTYTVSYNSNKPSNASGTITGSTANSNHTYDVAKNLTPNGYKLTGWTFTGWKDSNGKTYTDKQSVKNLTTENGATVVLYAQWKPNSYTIRYDSNKPSTASSNITGITANSTHSYDTAKNLTANGYKLTGWTFTGWKDSNGKTYTDKQSVKNLTTENGATIVLYAQWKPNSYTIRYDSNKPSTASGNITGTTANSTHSFDTAKNLTANGYKLTGWTFTGWKDSYGKTYTDKQLVKNLTTENGATVVLYAQWKPNSYTIRYDSNKPSTASGNITGTTANSTHNYDTAKNLTANGYKLTGWTFTGWKDSNGKTYTDKQSVKNLTTENGATIVLYAQWKPNSYTIRYDSNKPSTASGNITGTTANSTHSYDTAKNLTANGYKLTGWTFTGWKDSNGKTYTDKQSVKNLTTENGATIVLYAQWKPNTYTIHYDGNGATSGSTPDSNMTYDKPGTLNKNGFKKNNATFIGWKNETGKPYKDGQTVSNLTPNDKGVVKLIAQWDLAPEIKANDKTYYEGMTVTRADLLKDVVANDKEDGVITNKLIITKIEYSAGKLVNGKKQAAYTQEWANGMPADAKLDTWFMQLDKADSPVKHKVTYKVVDKVGNVTTKTVTVYVKYNNAPVITTIDRYYTLKEAQSGVISADELLKNSITNNKMKSTDIEEGNLSSKVELVDFNPSDFTKLTTSAVVTVTYRVHDSYGPNGVGKETINQFKVYITDPDRPPIRPDDSASIVKHVRFITKKYYDLNKDKKDKDLTDEEIAKANANGGLRVGCSWYSNPEYKSEITATFDKTSGTTYKFSHEDVEKIQEYINTNGIGNAKKANSLSTFYQKFLNK